MHSLSVIIFALVFTFSAGLPRNVDKKCNECVCGVRGRAQRIVGGSVTLAHEYPWLVGLSKQGKMYCGGSLITKKHILTAAHCINGMEPADIRVYVGGHNITKDYSEIRRVRKFYEHEHFDIISFDNDIAIIELDQTVKYGSTVQPVCLPDESIDELSGSMGIIAGWGRLGENKPTSAVLRSLVVPVWSHEQCQDSGYGAKRITENMMCAGFHDGGKDACQGDSGGALHKEGSTGSMDIVGIVSWGRGCARPNLPGLYTKVVNYLPWIQKILANECMCSPKSADNSNSL